MVRRFVRQTTKAVQYLSSHKIAHRDIKPENILVVEVPPNHQDSCGDGLRSGTSVDENGSAPNASAASKTPQYIVQLADFGWAVGWSNHQDYQRTLCGTPEYVPPELLKGKPLAYRAEFVDPWALGVLAIELVLGISPFLPRTNTESDAFCCHGSSVDDESDCNPVTGQIFRNIRSFQGMTSQHQNILAKVAKLTSADIAEMTLTSWEHFWDWTGGLLQIRPERRRTATAALNHPWLQPCIHEDVKSSWGKDRKPIHKNSSRNMMAEWSNKPSWHFSQNTAQN